ncbi:MAG: carboxypeptidase regulatory-like domain-containing protein [Gemmatimonadetes bacterium]|nr:carboxypeptidase regulatory-like domain-containing protein [Gemmatimonadota bacterium]
MRRLFLFCLLVAPLWLGNADLAAQGITTATLSGTVRGPTGEPIRGVTISAIHQPSGTRYGGVTRADGRYSILGMRVGGPYRLTASGVGRETQVSENVSLNLGVATDIDFVLREAATAIEGITITGQTNAVLSPDRTGAATSLNRDAIERVPTITGRLSDVARQAPQAGRGLSFAGQDTRMNNITIDGAYFNNSFGLGSSAEPGGRTGVAPVSLEAVEQVQINIAPYDVRQGNFVGAGLNTVTRSGTNQFRGSLRYEFRDESLVGTQAGANAFDPGTFNQQEFGGWLSGPILRNKLFFFMNYEKEGRTGPGTNYRANAGGEKVEGTTTRVLRSDLEQLSSFLNTNLGYDTGPFQGYEHETPATRFLGKLDYNLSESHKFSLRYIHLNSFTDVLASGSTSLGFGNRNGNTNALNFQNSNYQIKENIRSLVGEWNATLGSDMANNLILGYTFADESRASRGQFFPYVDILEAGATYTSFGFEAFTPNNELRYGQYQFQNNFTKFGVAHTLTFGVSAERYESENVFFPGSQSVYVYNSLQDFYRDVNDFRANPNRTVSPVTLRRFQVRYSNIPGQEKPVQPLEVLYGGIYGQDEWQVNDDLRLTLGMRVDAPFFGKTGLRNEQVEGLSFRDEDGNSVRYQTDKLPAANPLLSPRIGVNWDVRGDRTTQVRGGTGIFTGRPAYVWISNQIGENGILTGFEQLENTRNRPFNPDPNRYKPTSVTGAPARSYGLAFTDTDFRFPQVWRSNLAIDQQLPFGLVGTGEFLYGRDVNGVYYINANLNEANSSFSGPDNRPRWSGSNRINSNITSAIVLKNQNEGYSWHASASVQKQFRGGLFVKGGYSVGDAYNTIDPGSIAFGSWSGNPISGDPNNPGVSRSSFAAGRRAFGTLSYRKEYFRFGATTVSLFGEAITGGFASYTYSGDLNGDGGFRNDLLYVPKDASEMNFQPFTVRGRTFTRQEQEAAFEEFIQRDPYLRSRRGQYAERNGARLPMDFQLDASFTQEIFRSIAGRRNGLEFRADVINAGNYINEDWGVGRRFVSVEPLTVPSSRDGGPADAQGRAQYRMATAGNELITSTAEAYTQATAGLRDVYSIQFSLRYTFR